MAFGLGHRCMKCQRGFRWILLPLRIVHPRKHEALLPAPQVHQPRLRRMQPPSQPVHHQPDPPERFPGLRSRSAHHHEIIGIPDQHPSWRHRAAQSRSSLFR
jgi:hypothetical protein